MPVTAQSTEVAAKNGGEEHNGALDRAQGVQLVGNDQQVTTLALPAVRSVANSTHPDRIWIVAIRSGTLRNAPRGR